jgi:hypothetical protein
VANKERTENKKEKKKQSSGNPAKKDIKYKKKLLWERKKGV